VSVFNKIKKKYRNYFFRKEIGKINRKKKVINYIEAKDIGIIYDASSEENYLLIANLTRELQKDGKKVNTLGYIRQKKRPQYSFPRLILGFFSMQDFTWNYKSRSNFINEFLERNFDILLDLSPADIFFAKYIAGLTKATYKAGIYDREYFHIYDLLIDVNESCSLEERIEHSLHYLKTINSQKDLCIINSEAQE